MPLRKSLNSRIGLRNRLKLYLGKLMKKRRQNNKYNALNKLSPLVNIRQSLNSYKPR